ncbi:hypothetical protein GQX74_013680 [Glossina fuscipes]|nr:hypothetical protein GQX74_013680 [Glossina fuscipes]
MYSTYSSESFEGAISNTRKKVPEGRKKVLSKIRAHSEDRFLVSTTTAENVFRSQIGMPARNVPILLYFTFLFSRLLVSSLSVMVFAQVKYKRTSPPPEALSLAITLRGLPSLDHSSFPRELGLCTMEIPVQVSVRICPILPQEKPNTVLNVDEAKNAGMQEDTAFLPKLDDDAPEEEKETKCCVKAINSLSSGTSVEITTRIWLS